MRPRFSMIPAAVFAAAITPACGGVVEDEAETSDELADYNGQKYNGQKYNGLDGLLPPGWNTLYDGVPMRTLLATTPMSAWSGNDTIRPWINHGETTEHQHVSNGVITTVTEPIRTVFVEYLVRCALPQGTSLSIRTPSGWMRPYPGTFGLAAGWLTGAIGTHAQEKITACVLAHVNGEGYAVEVSFRGMDIPTTDTERTRFWKIDLATFGNFFYKPQAVFMCDGNQNVYETGRTCGDRRDHCGMSYVGPCELACDGIRPSISSGYGFPTCYSGDITGVAGRAWPYAMTVFTDR
jgi:hypothetical protein